VSLPALESHASVTEAQLMLKKHGTIPTAKVRASYSLWLKVSKFPMIFVR
jgi:hypothetical protein